MDVSVKAPAKINLTLDVLHKRADGYHELEMLMTTIDLSDRIDLTETRGGITLDSTSGFVPFDDRNLAYRAVALVKERFGIQKGIHVRIRKNIPVAAGLAGGSSDAAAALKGLNRLWDLGLTVEEMAELGLELGSDVPFCIHGGTAIARGRGEKITPVAPPPPCWVILAKPPHGVSTAEVFAAFQLDQVEERPRLDRMMESLERRDFGGVCHELSNVLESVTLVQYPKVRRLKEKMITFGAQGVLMSGSGPTVFGLVQRENLAKRVVNGLRGFCRQVVAVRLLGGLERSPLDKKRLK
ncbi:4-diphosphocytidyl-2-C-methyl-D-erythritol kinase [Kroppenstedtia guangzhouensis]|uniref:4-diphosphocytidyl-2-C-methyl-D-erythritol kinase n=1 Tax=Kroppenstedtia guangzhouensis TaxID=1274356 RepID=A0ABQ1GXJ6_9BACL|nr:4-(cytidine 5'-diphospho)-2-C-methyl-D-erythritol kinase [Kroppenstedtia guangzhouensis]GGA52356.1 4-diphosphocytidyl-2-C-methyl-D-erythritol kinase [Kroppenstedtia guangzhouensis]